MIFRPPPKLVSRLAVRDKAAFTSLLEREFVLDRRGYHGPSHWARVERNGSVLCRLTGTDARVVRLFALLHDVRREDEGTDLRHGHRSARFVRDISRDHLELGPDELARLAEACAGHSEGETSRDPIIGACWDADRLDLGRVGKRASPAFLSLDAAKDPRVIAYAERRATRWLDGRRRR